MKLFLRFIKSVTEVKTGVEMLLFFASHVMIASLSVLFKSTSINEDVTVVPEDTSDSASTI